MAIDTPSRTASTDAAAVAVQLREQGVDVVRVSYADLIGVDRGRDVLLEELERVAGHGLAFCRAVYHTTPMGDVVPVAGGLDAGLPDISVIPDLATLTPLPWEPGAAWCVGDARGPDGAPAPESPRPGAPPGGAPPSLAAPRRAGAHRSRRARTRVLRLRAGRLRHVAALRRRA